MKSFIKKGFFLLLLIAAVTAKASVYQATAVTTNAVAFHLVDGTSVPGTNSVIPRADSFDNDINIRYNSALARLKQQATSLEKYITDNNYNTEYVFLVDMSLPSGKNRFFVYNLKKDIPEHAGLVTHGAGSNKYDTDEPLKFSNMPFSFKTSVGKYKIGSSYSGRFGLAYKLYGLDSSNSKAYERAIVLHAHKQVPDAETYPGYIIVSAGCPTVSPAFLAILNKYITASRKPILMWIYN